jgi:hypothetical protein
MTESPSVNDVPVRREGWAAWVLWPVAYLAALGAVSLGVCGSSLPGWNLGLVLDAFMAGSAIAVIWGVCFVAAAVNTPVRMSRRALARWLGIPALGFVGLALMLSGIPMTVRFELSRAALDQAAARAAVGHTVDPGWIGLIPVDWVSQEGGEAYFFVAGSGWFGPCALVHEQGSSKPTWPQIQDFGGGWWLSCEDD